MAKSPKDPAAPQAPVTDASATTPGDPPLQTSMVRATIGRDVHLFSNRWSGPRAAKVVGCADAPIAGSDRQVVDVNVQLHGVHDAGLLTEVRARAHGGTVTDVPLYDSLDEGGRAVLLAAAPPVAHGPVAHKWYCWAEWPARI